MKVFDDLEEAQKEYLSAKSESDFARRNETQALNNLNAAQKAVDDYLEKVRKSHPADSDWGSRGRKGESV